MSDKENFNLGLDILRKRIEEEGIIAIRPGIEKLFAIDESGRTIEDVMIDLVFDLVYAFAKEGYRLHFIPCLDTANDRVIVPVMTRPDISREMCLREMALKSYILNQGHEENESYLRVASADISRDVESGGLQYA